MEMMAKFARVPNFKHKLLLTRKSLVGNSASPTKGQQSEYGVDFIDYIEVK